MMSAVQEQDSGIPQSWAEAGVTYTLGDVIANWQRQGFCIDQIPLGGTIAMQRGIRGELIASSEGCFGSKDIEEFNQRTVHYSGRPSLEPGPTRRSSYVATMKEAGYPATYDVLYSRPTTIIQDWPNGSDMNFSMNHRQFPPGEYRLGQLLNDTTAVPFYAELLSREITSGKYPNGVRLDSTQLYEKSGVFAAVVCSYIIPKIYRSLKEYSTNKHISMDAAMREAIFIVPVGTDRQVEIANFFDLLSFFTGITFITVGANSPFEDPEAISKGIKLDAKTNLEGVDKVIAAIRDWKLSPGMTYSIADGLVMRNLVQKMRPDARGLLEPVKARDGRYYGSTFNSYFAIPIDKLSRLKANSAYVKPRYDVGMLHSLTPFEAELYPQLHELASGLDEEAVTFFKELWSQTELKKMWRENAALKSARYAQALESVKRTTVTDRVELIPLGTRVWIVEGGGDGNSPAQTAEAIWHKSVEQSARTRGAWKPLIIVGSDCGYPSVSEDYDAGLYRALKKKGIDVVSGRTVPSRTLELLSEMLLYRKLGDNTAYFDDAKARIKLEPDEIEKLLEFYGGSRTLPGFIDFKPRI